LAQREAKNPLVIPRFFREIPMAYLFVSALDRDRFAGTVVAPAFVEESH
jgi:hypothetical protein